VTEADCPELIRDVVMVEGRVESLLTDISSLKRLEPEEITTLGLFRQGCQTLRQAIYKGETNQVPYYYKQPQYHLFNRLMIAVSRLVIAQKRQPSSGQSQASFDQVIQVRSAEWEKAVMLIEEKQPWESLINTVTTMRLARG
jgi:hypothetical protein